MLPFLVRQTVLLAAFCGFLPLWAQTTPGSLQGTVVGDDGAPLLARLSARVALAEAPPNLLKPVPPPIATGPMVASATSATDGSFQLTGLPAGKLVLCAQVVAGGYLDPCQWSARLPGVTLAAGQAATGFKLVLQKGSVLNIRVNDPSSALQAVIGSSRPLLLVGVLGPMRLLLPAVRTSQDAFGYLHQVTVPLDMQLRLMIASSGLAMLNAQGAPVDPKGYVVEFVHRSGQDNSAPVVFQVVGRTP